MKPLTEQTYYEILELDPSASMQEVRASFERLNRMLDEDNVALYPLVDTSQLADHRAMILEAMEFLTDADLRLEYDRSIGLPPRAWKENPAPESRGEAEEASPEGTPAASQVTQTAPPASQIPELRVPAAACPDPEPRAIEAEPAPTQLVMQELVARAEAVHSTLPNLSVSWLPHVPRPMPATLGTTMLQTAASTPVSMTEAPDVPSSTRSSEPPPATEPQPVPEPPALPEATFAPAPAPEPQPAPEPPALPAATLAPAPAPEPQPVPEPPALPVATPASPTPAPESQPTLEPPAPVSLPAPPRALEQAQPLTQDSAQVSMQVGSRAPREVRPRPVDIPSDAEFNGELLRQVRKSRGFSLAQVADRTRITLRHLENVEADRYDALPPTVYLRGILMSLARELGLDSLRVSRSYLSLVDKQLSGQK